MQSPQSPDQAFETSRSKAAAPLAPTDEIIEFCQCGLSIIFGVRGLDGSPIVGIGIASLIGGDIRLIVARPNNRDALLALTRDSRIAATFTRISDHRSIQIKGHDAIIAAVQPDDVRAATVQSRRFRDAIIDRGYSEDYASSYCSFDPAELVAIVFTPVESYTQTPGPGAGSPLPISADPK